MMSCQFLVQRDPAASSHWDKHKNKVMNDFLELVQAQLNSY